MNSITLLNQGISGGILVASLVAGLFFNRFWRRSHERLFLALSVAFFLLAVERTVLLVLPVYFVPIHEESRHWVYLVRLAAFLVMLLGILEKNLGRKPGRTGGGG